jgi:hypothetical protein
MNSFWRGVVVCFLVMSFGFLAFTTYHHDRKIRELDSVLTQVVQVLQGAQRQTPKQVQRAENQPVERGAGEAKTAK